MKIGSAQVRFGSPSCWIEVAPALYIVPQKPSNTPTLETITEEDCDHSDDENSSVVHSFDG
ncbi:hypothetical protein F511_39440 [Dorcoceras hygrometricum]|uniref:Uncharacterized protein n=1 Tax=Dorcoceras hygrometricum TaxID=472368 RepID=A0A2Z7BQT2_9LAMI|nr:hypothetical protein F511_39440 [Dorcoceras hygrometricum]